MPHSLTIFKYVIQHKRKIFPHGVFWVKKYLKCCFKLPLGHVHSMYVKHRWISCLDLGLIPPNVCICIYKYFRIQLPKMTRFYDALFLPRFLDITLFPLSLWKDKERIRLSLLLSQNIMCHSQMFKQKDETTHGFPHYWFVSIYLSLSYYLSSLGFSLLSFYLLHGYVLNGFFFSNCFFISASWRQFSLFFI